MLVGLLQQQKTHSRTRHTLYTGRNCGTLRVLNPTGSMRKTVRTQFLEDKLRFETGGGVRARSRHHTADWSDALRIGNPIRSDLVTQYMTFTREEQKKAGVAVKQAPAVLPSHLHTIVSPLRARLQCTSDPYTRVVLARDLALFTVAFKTTKRGDELSRTLIERILRLPNHSGFLFNFQWGKTMRDGADHLYFGRIKPRLFGNVPSHGRRTTCRHRISHRLGYDPGILIPEYLSRRGGRRPHSR